MDHVGRGTATAVTLTLLPLRFVWCKKRFTNMLMCW